MHSSLYLYPTDSLYGLGGVATASNVQRINSLKQRVPGKHYSLIAPSFTWIQENFFVTTDIEQQRAERTEQYGPITVLCKKRNAEFLNFASESNYLGIRYIQHPFQAYITGLGLPFLSSSANISGEPYNLKDIYTHFAPLVDITIKNFGSMTGLPSTLIHYDTRQVTFRI